MEINNKAIIADTSALVSLATTTDQNHTVALKAAENLRKTARPIILPADILVETINVLGRKSGHDTALKAADALLSPGSQFVLVETVAFIKEALEKFKQQPASVSYTDCIVMAVADHFATKDIFGFDLQFVNAGYTRLIPSTDWRDAA